MKTVYKLILKSYLGPMIATFFIVIFILMMNFVWRYIEDLVGKGLDAAVIIELILCATVNMIQMGLPLAVLLATIMAMGNLGENYELLAMKSAGMSLLQIVRPLVFVVLLISIGSFFIINNLAPYSNKKMFSIIHDIQRQNQALEFQNGLFFNGIDNMSIRVEKQNPETKLLTGVLIYDNRSAGGNMTTTIADSGYIRLSEDKRYLLVTLFNGSTYEHTRSSQWYNKNSLRRHTFERQDGQIPMTGFDFERTDANLFSGSSQTQNIVELQHNIDSLEMVVNRTTTQAYNPLLRDQIFIKDPDAISPPDTIFVDRSRKIYAKNLLDRSKNEWHRKLALPVSIFIFFLIGAPLGAIIRKGGLGMPIVISVIFFVIYYVISISGEKMAKEGSWSSLLGMWISSIVLFPLAVYLTRKATNDSALLDIDWYIGRYKHYKEIVEAKIPQSWKDKFKRKK